jgi:hypothetical protein
MTADPAGGGVRALRAGVLAAVTLGLAAAAHMVGGGEVPGLPVLAVALGPLALGSALLTRRRLGAVALLAWLAPVEALLHGLFGATASDALATGFTGGHGHGAAVAGMPLTDSVGSSSLAVVSGAGHAGAGMLVAHAVATVLTGLALSHGERVLWLLWESLRPTLVMATVPLGRAPALVVAGAAAGMPSPAPLRFSSPRGPPFAGGCPT